MYKVNNLSTLDINAHTHIKTSVLNSGNSILRILSNIPSIKACYGAFKMTCNFICQNSPEKGKKARCENHQQVNAFN